MTQDINNIPTTKIYKDKAIYTAGLLGGPLAAGYIIAQNFKAFGDNEKYKKALLISVATTIILYTAIVFIPGTEKLPKYIVPLIYTYIAYALIRFYQGKSIDEHISKGGQTYNIGRTLLVALISLFITCVTTILPLYFLMPSDKLEDYYFNFKNQRNEIQYYPDDIGKKEVQSICEKLSYTDFFDSTYKQNFCIDKIDKTYQIKIPSFDVDNPEVAPYFKEIQTFIQQYYPDNKVEFIICDSLYNIKKTVK